MPNPAVAQLIADALPMLTHPGDDKSGPIVLPLPMFRPAALPPEMAKQFAADAGLPSPDIAKLVAEAIVHLLDSNGKAVIDRAELEHLRADAQAGVERHRQPHVHCHCGTPLFRLNIDSEKPRISGSQLITALSGMDPDCSVGHRKAD